MTQQQPPAHLAWSRVFRAHDGRVWVARTRVDVSGVTTLLGVINGDMKLDLGGGELATDRDRETVFVARFGPNGAHLASRNVLL